MVEKKKLKKMKEKKNENRYKRNNGTNAVFFNVWINSIPNYRSMMAYRFFRSNIIFKNPFNMKDAGVSPG